MMKMMMMMIKVHRDDNETSGPSGRPQPTDTKV